jgi:hypothetical protein
MEYLEDILPKLCGFILYGLFVHGVYRFVKNKGKKLLWVICLIHGILLTAVTFLFLNQPRFVLSEEVEFMGSFKNPKSSYVKEGYEAVKNNFILIDNSFDKALIPNPEGSEGDSTKIAITDRKKLISFFELMKENLANIDLVICDIGFNDTTGSDEALKAAMDSIYAEDKLLISYDEHRSKNPTFQFPPGIYGSVREPTTHDRLFVTHSIYTEGMYSLPYKMYMATNKVKQAYPGFFNLLMDETDSAGRTHKTINTFLPQFSLIDEKILLGQENIEEPRNAARAGEDTFESQHWFIQNLGYVLTDDGRIDFEKNLSQRKVSMLKNVIFIGTFRRAGEDVHETAFGTLHGTTILLNLWYELRNRTHYFSWWLALLMVLFFAFITWMVTSGREEHIEKHLDWMWMPFKFLFENSFHLLVLLFVILVYIVTQKLFNCLSLLIYFLVLDLWWTYYNKGKS